MLDICCFLSFLSLGRVHVEPSDLTPGVCCFSLFLRAGRVLLNSLQLRSLDHDELDASNLFWRLLGSCLCANGINMLHAERLLFLVDLATG
jgi:hypothetical protein